VTVRAGSKAVAEKPDLSYAFGLPPEKAVEYFKSKGYAFSWDWHDTWQEAHAKAFTVAKATRMDVLEDIRSGIDKALTEGTTLQQFKNELTPQLQAKGWWGRKMVGDEEGAASVQLGSPYRLQTIYQTNMQTAYSAGRYKEQMDDVAERPNWQYVAILDSHTRPAHRALNGKVFPFDDPFWNTFYPPIDWNCRCRVRTLTDGDVAERKLTVENSGDSLKTEERPISRTSDKMAEVTTYTDPETGVRSTTGPGWNYNPGKAAWFPDLDKYDYKIASQYVQGGLTGPDFTMFFRGKIGGNFPVAVLDKEYKDAIGSKSQTVYLSDETLAKNIESHPELKAEAYQALPDIIAKAQLIVQDGDNTFVFYKQGKDIYYGAVKTTRSGETNFLTSLRKAQENDIKVIRRKGKILKDEL
jgi:SPP1 gp7 family putative phage head morphogenesis protein